MSGPAGDLGLAEAEARRDARDGVGELGCHRGWMRAPLAGLLRRRLAAVLPHRGRGGGGARVCVAAADEEVGEEEGEEWRSRDGGVWRTSASTERFCSTRRRVSRLSEVACC